MKVVICEDFADGRTSGMQGLYLQSYDAEGFDGQGDVVWTGDVKKAMRFAGVEEVFALYRLVPTARPVRPDGHPNRPLTAFSISVVEEPLD